MRQLVVLAALVTALAAAGAASAGGWATVGFAPLPDGTQAGETWRPEITVLQHGRTPLGGLRPILTIRDADSGESRSFTATPTAETGVYEALVVFPSSGRWGLEVESGFGDSSVTYGPVTIAPGPTGGDSGPFPVLPVLVVACALVLAAVGVLGARRLRRLTPASR